MGTAEAVERTVAPVLSTLGYELLDVEARPGLVRLIIDRPSGLDIDAISEATHAVSGALDDSDVVPGGRYELEVSSPGVERRLRRPEHYARVVGSRVAVKLRAGSDADRRLEGSLVSVDGDGICLEMAGQPSRRLSYDDIEKCHTVFDWRAALAADSSSRGRDERRARPSAADRSRAAAAARAGETSGAHDDRHDRDERHDTETL